MFEATTHQGEERRKSRGAAPLSLAIHGGFLAVIALLSAREVIEKPPEEVEVTFFSAAPPPPPPPPPAGAATPQKKPKVEKKPDIQPTELVQPTEVPEEVPEVEEQVAEVDPNGQVGGQEGGQAGGQVGGQVGGKEDGKIGGDINSLGVGESKGLVTQRPAITYPDQARAMSIEGTVRVRILVDIDGKIVKNKDEACKDFQTADKKVQRDRWHPGLCIEAVSGPDVFYYESLMAWGTAKFKPWQSGNVNARYFANVDIDFKLQ